MQLAHYLNDIACLCAPDNLFAQDAINHAITTGFIQISFNPQTDQQNIVNNYDSIIEHFHARLHREAIAA